MLRSSGAPCRGALLPRRPRSSAPPLRGPPPRCGALGGPPPPPRAGRSVVALPRALAGRLGLRRSGVPPIGGAFFSAGAPLVPKNMYILGDTPPCRSKARGAPSPKCAYFLVRGMGGSRPLNPQRGASPPRPPKAAVAASSPNGARWCCSEKKWVHTKQPAVYEIWAIFY